MNRTTLLALTALTAAAATIPAQAFGPGDYMVIEGEERVLYLDPTQLQVDGDLVLVEVGEDLRDSEGHALSLRSSAEFDCGAGAHRLLSVTGLSEPAGRGVVVRAEEFHNAEWDYLAEGTPGTAVRQFVCDVAEGVAPDEVGTYEAYAYQAVQELRREVANGEITEAGWWWAADRYHR